MGARGGCVEAAAMGSMRYAAISGFPEAAVSRIMLARGGGGGEEAEDVEVRSGGGGRDIFALVHHSVGDSIGVAISGFS